MQNAKQKPDYSDTEILTVLNPCPRYEWALLTLSWLIVVWIMRWGRALTGNILLHWYGLKFVPFFLFCSDFHIDLTKHTAPWLPAAEQTQPPGRRQAWLCSDKDMLNSASHYLHFFFLLASCKLKGMQIKTGLCERVVMSWNNEVRCVCFGSGAWLDCQDFTKSGGRGGDRGEARCKKGKTKSALSQTVIW